jgi:hypothetical protein
MYFFSFGGKNMFSTLPEPVKVFQSPTIIKDPRERKIWTRLCYLTL